MDTNFHLKDDFGMKFTVDTKRNDARRNAYIHHFNYMTYIAQTRLTKINYVRN